MEWGVLLPFLCFLLVALSTTLAICFFQQQKYLAWWRNRAERSREAWSAACDGLFEDDRAERLKALDKSIEIIQIGLDD